MAETQTFSAREVLRCSTAMRSAGEGATCVEEIAADVVAGLRSHFIDKQSGASALPLVRFYVTQRYGDLEPAVQDFARAAGPDAPAHPGVICLTLVATAGEDPAWNDRQNSVGHKAVPLPSVEALRRSPMVARLIEQLGVDPAHLVAPNPELFVELSDRSLNIFFVPEARESPYVPAQANFVIPYGIRSVLGFGGVLPDGLLYAVILFSSTTIPPEAVDGFLSIALSVKFILLPMAGKRVLSTQSDVPSDLDTDTRLAERVLRAEVNTLSQLLDVRAAILEDEVLRLETEMVDTQERAAELAVSRDALATSEARKTAIVEGALDCIIGMDSTGRITDFNRAAEDTFGYDRHEVIGQVLSELIIPYGMRERHRHGLATLLATGEGPVIGRRIEVNALRRDGTEFPVELTVTPVLDTVPPLFNGFVRDISAQRATMAELEAGRERLARIARTLQTSLLPPVLPTIDSFELGAAFQALGEGYEVGGDFYDAFEVNDRLWGLSLGDVCGKGSAAAVITALARYTLRAAAMRNREPAAVLETLNEAIHRQHPDQFCTAAYATVDPASGRVKLALGGHPRPLLLSADGSVRAVGASGRLLGPFASWEGSTETIALAPGDTLVLFSDGVTEARHGNEFFGDERLADAVRAARGMSAASAASLVESRVLGFAGELTDDLAILAARYTPHRSTEWTEPEVAPTALA